MEVDQRQLDALIASGQISSVEVNAKAKRHLAQSVPLVRAPQAWSAGVRGGGQVVVVIDDGVDGAHPFLAGRVVAEACAAPDCDNDAYRNHARGSGKPCQSCDHGTHVAGIVAGSSGSRKGVAPAADIISIRVFSTTDGSFEGIASALDYTRTELAKITT
jgi:subtilisin family serine protease